MGLPRRHVRDIERREIEAIYRQNYWDAVRGDELPPGVDLAVWDFGVNSGPGRAIRALQKVLGVRIDGHLGAGTIAAVRAAEPVRLIRDLMDERRRFVRQIKHYPTFAKGWERRCAGIEAVATTHQAMAARVPGASLEWATEALRERAAPTIVVPLPLPEPDAQSASQGRATPPATPARVGIVAKMQGWVLGALGLGAVAQEAAPVLPLLDPGAALSLWDRVEPLVTRLATSTAGHVALAACGVGLVVWLIGRAAQRREILDG
jgi:lysozyme family protein